MSELLSRREFLGTLAVSALVLAGCGEPVKPPTKPSVPAPAIVAIATPIPPSDPRERLSFEINRLPDSPIKAALIARALPYYQGTPPFTLNRAGLPIKVYGASISKRTANEIAMHGDLGIRDSKLVPSEIYHPLSEAVGKLPLPNLLTSQEKAKLPQQSSAPDKTPLFRYEMPASSSFYAGLWPNIVITTPDHGILDPGNKEFYQRVEKFAYIKEASSLLFIDLYLEEIQRKCQELGLPTTIPAKNQLGEVSNREIVTNFWDFAMGHGGRITASSDIAGYLIALKAMEKTGIPSVISHDPRIKPTVDLLSRIDLGQTPHDIWVRSMEESVTNPALQSVQHLGDTARLA